MSIEIRKIAIVGLGYIGLPTATLLAGQDINVVGIDINSDVVNTVNRGEVHIVEPVLQDLVHQVVRKGKLKASIDYVEADVFIITVPTPITVSRKSDLSFIESAVKSIAPKLKKGNLIILESTSPVGTTEKISRWLTELRPDLSFPKFNQTSKSDIYISYCPERVMPGRTIKELVSNDRVIGGMTRVCAQHAESVYKFFVKGKCLLTDARTAELSKLTENAFRDVNIAFANELSLVCDQLNINVWKLIELANHHPRVNILKPGCGVGGHCIAVDPWFIVDAAPKITSLIQVARGINDNKPRFVINKIRQAIGDKTNAKIVCLGLSFKKNIDDLRESAAVEIVKKISRFTSEKIRVVEPHIKNLPKEIKGQLVGLDEGIVWADIVVLLVDHDQFLQVKQSDLKHKKVINSTSLW